jgi:hypothetical protein
MPEISGSPRIGDAPNNVRYLGQSGGYMLTESFTARDPEPTSRKPSSYFRPYSEP